MKLAESVTNQTAYKQNLQLPDCRGTAKDSTVVAKDSSARTWLLCRLRAMRYEWNFGLSILR